MKTILVFASLIAVGVAKGAAGISEIKSLRASTVIGLSDLASTVRNVNDTLSVPRITSDLSLERVIDPAVRARDAEARQFGAELLASVSRINPKTSINATRDAVDLILLRDWLLREPSYGNILLGYALQGKACELLYRVLNDESQNVVELGGIVDRISTALPSYVQWRSMLENEGETAVLKGDDGKPQDKALVDLLGRVSQPGSGVDEATPLPRRSLEDCWQKRNIGQLAWNAVLGTLREVSLEVCINVRRAGVLLPEERDRFVAEVEKHASALVGREIRGGVRVDSFGVWSDWRAATARARTQQPENTPAFVLPEKKTAATKQVENQRAQSAAIVEPDHDRALGASWWASGIIAALLLLVGWVVLKVARNK